MSRYLDEIYCTAVRESGSHGTWEPGSWLWPGVTGLFRHGIFERLGFLKPEDWNYTVFAVESGPELVETEGIRLADFGAGASVKDPLGALVSAEAKLSYEVEGADEVLVLTRPGRWWEIDDIEGLLARIQAVLEEWPLTKTVICATFETSCGVVGISSRATKAFTVALDASGAPHIAVKASGGGRAELATERASRRAFPLPPKGDGSAPGNDVAPEQRRNLTYTPFFAKGFRVSKRLLDRFGRKRLVTFDGDPIPGLVARTDPEDLLYDPGAAEVSIEEAKAMPIAELFEEVTPELLGEEARAEIETEIFAEQAGVVLTPELLRRAGIGSIDYVSVSRSYGRHLRKLRRAAAVTMTEKAR